MDMWTGKFITKPKVVEIPITYAIITAVKKWQKSKDLGN